MQNQQYMKYIKLDQERFFNYSLDFTHACIYSWITQFSKAKTTEKLQNDQDFTWVSYTKIIHDLPILKLGKESIRKKVNELKNKKIIETRIIHDKVYINPKIFPFTPVKKDKSVKKSKITRVITVNQCEFLARVNSELSFKHAIIYYWLKRYITNLKTSKKKDPFKVIKKEQYYWFSYDKLINELPLLKIKNQDRVRAILKELSDYQMIKKDYDSKDKKMFIRIL